MTIPDYVKESLDLFSPKVRENVTVKHCSEFPVSVAFHITKPGVPNPFWPRMPASASDQEDKTVPRVIAASTLVGCMNGAAFILDNARDSKFRPKEERSNYYVILGMKFEYCLCPNNKLVYDAEDTQEQWLITYNEETKFYRHFNVGEFFIHSIQETITPNKTHNPTLVITYLKLGKGQKLAITQNRLIDEGCYKIVFDLTNYASMVSKRMRYDDDKKVEITPIEKSLYEDFRKLSVKKGL